MDKDERALFERMTIAQERLAVAQEQMTKVQEQMVTAVKKQQPSKAAQFVATAAAIATAIGGLSVVEMVIKWLIGG
jgi:hypothetical protein